MYKKSSEIETSSADTRYDLSPYSYRQLKKDYIRFNQKYVTKFPNRFISRILINYMTYAQENFLDEFEKNIQCCFAEYTKPKGYIEFKMSFTKEIFEKIDEFDFCKNSNFRKRCLVNYIINCFTSLSLSEREKIYMYNEYKCISKAIKNNYILNIKYLNDKEYEFKPFRLIIDDNVYSYYLVGYSRIRHTNDEFKSCCIKLIRIKSCKYVCSHFSINYLEKMNITEIIDRFGSAYIPHQISKDDLQNIIVKLTEHGYNDLFLKKISYQRPIPVSIEECDTDKEEKFYKLTFDCSYNQIYNYFFKFGEDAEIIQPKSLREKFIETYYKALKSYNKNN